MPTIRIRHILVATDFSDAARAACVHGAVLARLLRARVTLLNVEEDGEVDEPAYFTSEGYSAELHHAGRWMLRSLAAMMGRFEVRPAIETAVGRASDEICVFVRDHAVDLLVIGKRGRRTARPRRVGRTTHRTLRHVNIPTLVVPQGPESQDRPAELPRPSYRRLIVGFDFSEPSALCLRATIELARPLGAVVEALHVLRSPLVMPVMSDIGAWPLTLPLERQDELKETLGEAVRTTLGPEAARGCEHAVVPGADAATGLADAALSRGALVVITSRGRRRLRDVFFGSTTDSLLRLSGVPVLVLPLEYLDAMLAAPAATGAAEEAAGEPYHPHQ